MKYTKLRETAFQEIQSNAGILLNTFNPDDGSFELSNIIASTTGGVSFSAVQSFIDYGEDIDNAPRNVLELKRATFWEASISGTMTTIDKNAIAQTVGMADFDEDDDTHLVPRNNLLNSDFHDIWWVGDYSDQDGGFIAINLKRALSTAGFSIQSTTDSKGTFPFTFTGHYTLTAQDDAPFEIYIKNGDDIEVNA